MGYLDVSPEINEQLQLVKNAIRAICPVPSNFPHVEVEEPFYGCKGCSGTCENTCRGNCDGPSLW